MKAVILAGGLGTRISEESHSKPKPMIEIGEYPILWHIMKIYSHYGINEFIICCGYKSYAMKEYFSNYFLYNSDVTFNFSGEQSMEIHDSRIDNWKVTLVNTGLKTETGGRLRRIEKYVGDTFCVTYGDGLSDVNINEVINYHKEHNELCTLTAFQPRGRFGVLDLDTNIVKNFREKPYGDSSWISGGFMVVNKKVLNLISGDDCNFENDVLPILAETGKLRAYKHNGFFAPMDTLRDKKELTKMWEQNEAPWKIW